MLINVSLIIFNEYKAMVLHATCMLSITQNPNSLFWSCLQVQIFDISQTNIIAIIARLQLPVLLPHFWYQLCFLRFANILKSWLLDLNFCFRCKDVLNNSKLYLQRLLYSAAVCLRPYDITIIPYFTDEL